jgi:hypothetical protein
VAIPIFLYSEKKDDLDHYGAGNDEAMEDDDDILHNEEKEPSDEESGEDIMENMEK